LDGYTGIFDALNRRVELGNSPTFTQMIYPPFDPTFQMGGVSALTAAGARFPLPGGGQIVYSTSTPQFRHPNWQGSEPLTSYANGTTPNIGEAFTPFGEIYDTYAGDNGFFAGMLMVVSSGAPTDAFNAMARMYQSQAGRWVSPDPAGLASVDLTNPQTLNRYAYGINSPLMNTDPSGLDAGTVIAYNLIGACLYSVTPYYSGETGNPLGVFLSLVGCFPYGTQPGNPGYSAPSISGGTPGNPPLYCQANVISAMKKIWAESVNGTSGAEASFNVNGNPSNYVIVFNPYTNQRGFQTIQLQGTTFANFHVHPNTSTWQPSTLFNNAQGNTNGDTGVADDHNVHIYVVSRQGLGFYDPTKGPPSVNLRAGMDWAKACK
jgi:RHS repeat-associated protein